MSGDLDLGGAVNRRCLWATALVAVTVFGGCTPGDAEPMPSPTAIIPSTSPTSSPVSEEQVQQRAYQTAESNYRAVVAEVDRIFNAGGSDAASSTMKALSAGPYLKFQASEVRSAKVLKLKTEGSVQIQFLQRRGYSPSSLLFTACEDASRVIQTDPAEGTANGLIAVVRLESRKIDGTWKVWEAKYTVVKSCENY